MRGPRFAAFADKILTQNHRHRMLRAARSRGNRSSSRCEPGCRQLSQTSVGGNRTECGSGASSAGAFVPLTASTVESQRPSAEDQGPIFVSDIFAHTELLAAPVFDAANERTRPNLKVQDGCDNRCSFCVIPYVRGQSRSLSVDRIIREINALVDSGYREVVISGINLGRWGRDLSALDPSGDRRHRPSGRQTDWHPCPTLSARFSLRLLSKSFASLLSNLWIGLTT